MCLFYLATLGLTFACGIFVATCRLIITTRGVLIPWPGIKPVPPRWEPRALTTRPPENSQKWLFGYLAIPRKAEGAMLPLDVHTVGNYACSSVFKYILVWMLRTTLFIRMKNWGTLKYLSQQNVHKQIVVLPLTTILYSIRVKYSIS